MATCNGHHGNPGCGQEIVFEKVGGKWQKPKNPDGTPHVCSGAKTGLSGYEEAQVHSKAEQYMGDLAANALTTPLDNIHKLLKSIEDFLQTINLNQITQSDKLEQVLKVKGNSPTQFEELTSLKRDVAGLGDNFVRFAGALEALLIQKGFVTAGELYKDSKLDG